ncbi:MAG: Coenzyme F420 hydrogenase/dehydrogenase, beta subunit C-terminal domain [Thermoplasmata archaeon]
MLGLVAVRTSEGAPEEAPKTFADLLREVYDPGRCTFCLICLDACAREGCDAAAVHGDTFEYEPAECQTAGMCYISCPEVKTLDLALQTRYGVNEGPLGRVLRATCLTSSSWEPRSDDRGALRSLLTYLFEAGMIDAAVVPAPPGTNPTGHALIRRGEPVEVPRGDPFHKPQTVRFLRDLWRSEKEPLRLALVSRPCQTRMVRRMQLNGVPPSQNVALIIGEFCYGVLSNARWKRGFFERAVSPQGRLVESIDVPDDARVRYYDGTESQIDLADLYLAFDSSCLSCLDYSNRLADLSVGRAGSPAGFETVLVRTEAGHQTVGGATNGEYVLDWSAVFGRGGAEAFEAKLIASVKEKLISKARLSRRVGRRLGRPARFRP